VGTRWNRRRRKHRRWSRRKRRIDFIDEIKGVLKGKLCILGFECVCVKFSLVQYNSPNIIQMIADSSVSYIDAGRLARSQ
jgi:hypothetical protein